MTQNIIDKMLETIDGIFLSGQPEHVRIIEV